MDYFIVVSLITASKTFHTTDSFSYRKHHCDIIMGIWHCFGNYVMSEWIGDVGRDTNHSRDQQPGYFNQHPGQSDFSHKIQVVAKHGYFTSKCELSNTPQDNSLYCES